MGLCFIPEKRVVLYFPETPFLERTSKLIIILARQHEMNKKCCDIYVQKLQNDGAVGRLFSDFLKIWLTFSESDDKI